MIKVSVLLLAIYLRILQEKVKGQEPYYEFGVGPAKNVLEAKKLCKEQNFENIAIVKRKKQLRQLVNIAVTQITGEFFFS